MVLGSLINSVFWLWRFRFKSFAIDTLYLVSLATYLNWPRFRENFLAFCNLQVLSKIKYEYPRIKVTKLWQSTAEYLR